MNLKVLRLNLPDCIQVDYSYVLYFIKEIQKDTNKFQINFWYSPNDYTPDDISKIIDKHKVQLSELEYSFEPLASYEKTCWFDIISKKDNAVISKYKFRTMYNAPSEIYNCLLEFKKVFMFDLQKNKKK